MILNGVGLGAIRSGVGFPRGYPYCWFCVFHFGFSLLGLCIYCSTDPGGCQSPWLAQMIFLRQQKIRVRSDQAGYTHMTPLLPTRWVNVPRGN